MTCTTPLAQTNVMAAHFAAGGFSRWTDQARGPTERAAQKPQKMVWAGGFASRAEFA